MTHPSDDLDRIMAVMNAAFDPAFGEAWTRRQVEDALLLGNCHYALIAPDGRSPVMSGNTAGFSLSRYSCGEEELLLFAVSPQFRRRGLGGQLMQLLKVAAAERGAERLILEMRAGNPAESLYAASGFTPVGRRKDFYRGHDGIRIDAITFSCPL
jgi:ribosomal-protein-alanine N-acetyltransferase